MKKKNIFIVIISVFVIGCSKNYFASVQGNGKSVSEIRNLPEFTEIEISIGYDKVTVNSSSEQSLIIMGDENIVSLIQTKVVNGILKISSDTSFRTKAESEIIINMESVIKYIFDGVGISVIQNINEQHFTCALNGVGSCELSGNVDYLELSVNGVGSVDAKELIAEKVVASLNGVGSAEVHAISSLNALVNGIGGLTYYGEPEELLLNDSGLGGIKKGN